MSEEGFFARWSRRKRGMAEDEPAPEPGARAVPPPEAPDAARPAAAPPAEEPAFDPATLPPLESLGIGSDFTPFLRPGVPGLLRQAALRRMWSLDPGIRDFVGPADYAWDFNAPDGVPGFGPELVGDVKRLLAQAIGAPLEPEEKEPGEQGGEAPLPEAMPPVRIAEAGEGAEAAGAPLAFPAPPLRLAPEAEVPGAGLPESGAPQQGEPALLAASQVPPPLEIGNAAAPPPAVAMETVPLPSRRRHGGAIPS